MFKRESFAVAEIYVPTKRRTTLKPEVVEAIAASMLEVGQETPILVRRDGERLVLVEGLPPRGLQGVGRDHDRWISGASTQALA